jgi:hypothetical protein
VTPCSLARGCYWCIPTDSTGDRRGQVTAHVHLVPKLRMPGVLPLLFAARYFRSDNFVGQQTFREARSKADAMKAYRDKVQLHTLALAVDGGQWSASRPGRCTDGKRTQIPLEQKLGEPHSRSGLPLKLTKPPSGAQLNRRTSVTAHRNNFILFL